MSAETIDAYLNVRINMSLRIQEKGFPVKATTQAWFKGTFREADDAQ